MQRKHFTAEKIIHILRQADLRIERWRVEYNTARPHSSLGYCPPDSEARPPCKSTPSTIQRPYAAELPTPPPLS